MKTLYFDIFAGMSGDMTLGALTDLGCPLDEIKATLAGLRVPGFDLSAERVLRGPLSGTQVHVRVEEEHHVHRKLADMLDIADRVDWPGQVRQQIETAFTYIAVVEGRVHNRPYNEIHFHEVGSYDALIDVAGSFLGMHLLGIEKCHASNVHVGEGFVTTRHGKLPLPCPATAHLLEGFTTYSTGRPFEMVTPTGAAILKTVALGSVPMPEMQLTKVGYGAGSKNEKDLPNLLRVFLGEGKTASAVNTIVIESNIDDMNPEFFEPLLETLFQHGALDVTLTPIQMKKNRPATQLSVITTPARKEALSQIILSQSSAIGVRYFACERFCMDREPCEVDTEWGKIQGKVVWSMGIPKRFTPEYEDCKRIHQQHAVPMQQVYLTAIHAYQP